MNEHWHDEPGWEDDCHDCHLEGYGSPRDCPECES